MKKTRDDVYVNELFDIFQLLVSQVEYVEYDPVLKRLMT